MKKYAATLAAVLIALLGLAVLAPSAEAYPTPVLTLKLSLSRVFSGHTFVATAKASINCDSLSLTWNGQHASAPGAKLVHAFKAPTVTKATVITAVAVCTYTSVSGRVGTAISPSDQTLTAKANVTVLPLGGGTGVLPNTGGPSIAWLIAGLGALLAGALAMIKGRRRHEGAASS